MTNPAIYDEGFKREEAYREKCRKCSGTGAYSHLGPCFACKGIGYKEFKTAPETRAKSRASKANRQERIADDVRAAFAAQDPIRWAWISAKRGTFSFAAAMFNAVTEWGSLTEKQAAAVDRMIAQDAERNAEKSARVETAPSVDTSKLMACFDKAKANGLKRPQMRFGGFSCSMAPATGRNAGAVYVKSGNFYMGKIADGKFQATRECPDELKDKVVAAMADPLAEALAYARETGNCSCCGRLLTDPQSVAAGIGPICAENFGL